MEIKDRIVKLRKELKMNNTDNIDLRNVDLNIFQTDKDGRFLEVPIFLEGITGFNNEHLRKMSLEDVVLVEDRQKIRSALDSIKAGREFEILDIDVFSERTGAHPVEIVMMPSSQNEVFCGYLCGLRDVSTRKNMEQRLTAASEVQEASQRFLEDYVSLMAREIRQPLTSILLTLELFDSGFFGEVNDLQKQKLDQLINLVDSLKNIVNDALEASRNIGQEIDLDTRLIPINKLVSEVISEKDSPLKEKGVTVSFRDTGEDLMVPADRKMMFQVISDLLDNSIGLSPSGGEMVVELHTIGDDLQFSISDSGEGLSEEEVKNIFNKVIVDEARSRDSFRIGLNLYMARRVVETHGGRIWCESYPGLGSSFLFTIPVSRK